MAVREQVVTTNTLAGAKAKAASLCAAAYAAQPVQQPDGSTLLLCWNGRIARGYERLAAARAAKNEGQIRILQNAIRGLGEQYNTAANEAETAASNWAAMAAAAGVTVQPVEVYPPECQCEGCRLARAYHDHNEARGAYSDALYALLAPNSFELPPLLQLLESASVDPNHDRLRLHLKRIRDTGKAYIEACKAAGVRPNWRVALFPGLDE